MSAALSGLLQSRIPAVSWQGVHRSLRELVEEIGRTMGGLGVEGITLLGGEPFTLATVGASALAKEVQKRAGYR